jgi:hypothetical protein
MPEISNERQKLKMNDILINDNIENRSKLKQIQYNQSYNRK